MRLTDIVKKAGMDAFESAKPVNILYAEVESVSPLAVNVDQRFRLPASFLIVPESLTRQAIDLKHTHQYQDDSGAGSATKTTEQALTQPIVIREGLKAGDKVILLRVQGGQKYVILDRVVDS